MTGSMPDGFIPGRHGDDFFPAVINPPKRSAATSILNYVAVGSLISGTLGLLIGPGDIALRIFGLLMACGWAAVVYAAAVIAQSINDSAYWSRCNAELLRRAEERQVTSRPAKKPAAA